MTPSRTSDSIAGGLVAELHKHRPDLAGAGCECIVCRLNARIAQIHTERPCPKCGAEIGEQCRRMGRDGRVFADRHNRNAHQARYADLIR